MAKAADDLMTRAEIIVKLNEEHNLLDLFFDSIDNRKIHVNSSSNAKNEAAEAGDGVAALGSATCDIGAARGTQIRLNFLDFILKFSPLSLSGVKILQLWKIIIKEASSLAERDVGFEWFNRAFAPENAESSKAEGKSALSEADVKMVLPHKYIQSAGHCKPFRERMGFDVQILARML